MIMPAAGGMAQHQRAPPNTNNMYAAQGNAYIQPQGAFIPMQQLSPQSQPLLDNSFDQPQDPTLPARYEYQETVPRLEFYFSGLPLVHSST